MDGDKFKYQHAGLKWLYEMELLDDPQLINNLKLNIMDASAFKVKEVEFLMSQSQHKILVWVKLGWFHKRFFWKRTCAAIYERLIQLLPNYEFRIVTDRSILELAITKVKENFTGGSYAVSTTDGDIDDAGSSEGTGLWEEPPSDPSDLLPNQEEYEESSDDDEPRENPSSVESDPQG